MEIKDLQKKENEISLGALGMGVQQVGGITEETDPTVPQWAKQPNKPEYDYSEIKNTPDLNDFVIHAELDVVDNKANGAQNTANQAQTTANEVKNALPEYAKTNEVVQDVKVNGNSIKENGIANIPIAGLNILGVIKLLANSGLSVDAEGNITTVKATNDEISAKSQNFNPIVPANLDHAVKVGITTNTEVLTESEQTAAQEWLGINKKIGDISTALDELHTYAQSLINGGVSQ